MGVDLTTEPTSHLKRRGTPSSSRQLRRDGIVPNRSARRIRMGRLQRVRDPDSRGYVRNDFGRVARVCRPCKTGKTAKMPRSPGSSICSAGPGCSPAPAAKRTARTLRAAL